MYCCRTVCNLIQKQKICLYNGILVISRSCKLSSSLAPAVSNNGYTNKFMFLLNSFRPGQKNLNIYMNICTTARCQAPGRRTSQDKEKMKNYILYGGIMGACGAVFIISKILDNESHDHVYVELPKERKQH